MTAARLTVAACIALMALGCQSQNQSGAGGAPTRVSAADAVPIDAPSATLVVHGMSCPLCSNNVDKQLLKVPGVQTVSVDMGKGTVLVGFGAPRPTRLQLAEAVEKSGYTLVRIETP